MTCEAGVIVVKHGSAVVQNYNGIGMNQARINGFMKQHVQLREDGWETIEVCSGAVVQGRQELMKLGKDFNDYENEDLARAGTSGQARCWEIAALPYKIPILQVLATHQQIDDYAQGANIIKHIKRSTHLGLLNVINESDVAESVEMEEFDAGEIARAEGEEDAGADNDWMAAHTAVSIGATALLLLSDVYGFKKDNEIVPEIKIADIPEMLQYCYGSNGSGSGGMESKLLAAARAAERGINVVMGNAFDDHRALLACDVVCTRVVQ